MCACVCIDKIVIWLAIFIRKERVLNIDITYLDLSLNNVNTESMALGDCQFHAYAKLPYNSISFICFCVRYYGKNNTLCGTFTEE